MKVVIAVLAMVALASRVATATLFLDHFDGYANQAAFLASWPQAEDGSTSATLSTDQALSAPKSVRLGLGGGGQGDQNVGTIGELGLPSSTNSIRYSFDFYDTNAAAEPYAQSVSLIDGDGTGSGQRVAIGLNNNLDSTIQGGNFYMAHIRGFNANVFFKLNEGGASTVRSTGWHNLAVEISFVNASMLNFKFYVDNILARTLTNVSVTLRSYDTVFLGSGALATEIAYVDNVRVESFNPTAVPEAGAFATMGIAGFLAVGAPWMRRRLSRATS